MLGDDWRRGIIKETDMKIVHVITSSLLAVLSTTTACDQSEQAPSQVELRVSGTLVDVVSSDENPPLFSAAVDVEIDAEAPVCHAPLQNFQIELVDGGETIASNTGCASEQTLEVLGDAVSEFPDDVDVRANRWCRTCDRTQDDFACCMCATNNPWAC